MGICISSSTTKTVKTSNHDASVNISDHVAADNKKADDDVSELEVHVYNLIVCVNF